MLTLHRHTCSTQCFCSMWDAFLSVYQMPPPPCLPGTATRPPSPGDPLLFGDCFLLVKWVGFHLMKTL